MKQVNKLLTAGLFFAVSGLSAAGFQADAFAAADGKAVFEKHCSVCHSIAPPPKSAPPIVPISARYHQRFSSRNEGIRYMAAFIKSPSREKVLADPQAITRFGLMPAVPLGKEELNAVAAWVWDQNGTGNFGPGMGPGRGAGKGDCYQR